LQCNRVAIHCFYASDGDIPWNHYHSQNKFFLVFPYVNRVLFVGLTEKKSTFILYISLFPSKKSSFVLCGTNKSGYKNVVLAASAYYTHLLCYASNGIAFMDYELSGAAFRTRNWMPPVLHVTWLILDGIWWLIPNKITFFLLDVFLAKDRLTRYQKCEHYFI
jgi:hypothetical protein